MSTRSKTCKLFVNKVSTVILETSLIEFLETSFLPSFSISNSSKLDFIVLLLTLYFVNHKLICLKSESLIRYDHYPIGRAFRWERIDFKIKIGRPIRKVDSALGRRVKLASAYAPDTIHVNTVSLERAFITLLCTSCIDSVLYNVNDTYSTRPQVCCWTRTGDALHDSWLLCGMMKNE